MRKALPILGILVLFGAAIYGSLLLNAHGQAYSQDFPTGGLILVGAAILASALFATSVTWGRIAPLPMPEKPPARPFWASAAPLRLIAAGVGAGFAFGAWVMSAKGLFTLEGVFLWIASVAAWCFALDIRPLPPLRVDRWLTRLDSLFRNGLTGFRLRVSWALIALLVIMGVAALMRFYNVPAYPPDMDSDHVEVLLDINRIANGWHPVFVPSNSGREFVEFYFLTALHQLFNIPIGFDLLKIGDSLIGLLLIPLMWWFGRALFGEEDKHLGNLAGLTAAAFVAVSYWHIMLSRAGLRIQWMPVVTVPVLIFLLRAARHNRRIDWILTGLFLGISLYTYQSARILPLVVIAGWLAGMLMRARRWADWRQYTVNFGVAVLVSFVVFVPSARYMVDYPDNFWQRTTARILGDNVDAFGDNANPDLGPILAANLPNFLDNVRKSALMFNWRGDDTGFYGTSNGTAHTDAVTGALLAMGVGLVVLRTGRRADPADPLLIVSLLILLLPTALSLANLAEVPSAIRASGALPVVHIIAGLTLATITRAVWRHWPNEAPQLLYVGAVIMLWAAAAATNAYTYFIVQHERHFAESVPYREMVGLMGNFMRSTGAKGNAFMLASGLSWDHRALGIEAGAIGWDYGIVPEDRAGWIEAKIRQFFGTPFEFRPDRQVFFIMKPEDTDGLVQVANLFPGGGALKYQTSRPNRDFLVYVAPPMGCARFTERYKLVSQYCEMIQLPR